MPYSDHLDSPSSSNITSSNDNDNIISMPHFQAARNRTMSRLLDEATDAVQEYIVQKTKNLKSRQQRRPSTANNTTNNTTFVIPPLLTVKTKSDKNNTKLPPLQKKTYSKQKIGATIDKMDWKVKLLNNRIDNVKKRNNVIMKSWKKQLQRADKAETQVNIMKTELKNVKSTLQKYIAKEDPKFKQNLKSTLTCAVCLDLLYQPISLPKCAHKFCKLCWVKCALHAAERGDITQCPQCRVYEDGVDFPIDNTLFNTIQLLFPNECYERRKNFNGV